MVMVLRSKRGADAAADDASSTANKRQQSNSVAVSEAASGPASASVGDSNGASLDEDGEDFDRIDHHRYPIERKSDLVITMEGEDYGNDGHTLYMLHEHHVHQQVLAQNARYFAHLIDNADNQTHMTVDLPDELDWIESDFEQWLDIVYGKYNDLLNALAYASNVQAFSELLYPTGCTTTLHGDKDANGVFIKWTVVGHRPSGQIEIRSPVDNRLVTFTPGRCELHGRERFYPLNSAWHMDLHDVLRICHYFQAEQLAALLYRIFLQYVAYPLSSDLLLALAADADRYRVVPSAEQLRMACIGRLAGLSWKTSEQQEELSTLSPKLMVDLFTARAREAERKLSKLQRQSE